MSFDCSQFKEYIVKPSVSALGLPNADDAIQLLLMTCAQETDFGHYLLQKQIGYSGGVGIYQMESFNYHAIWDNMVQPYPAMRQKVKQYFGYDVKPMIQRMVSDLGLATMMARLFYARIEEPLPKLVNVNAMAAYYKKYWNTDKGAATIEQVLANYHKYVTC